MCSYRFLKLLLNRVFLLKNLFIYLAEEKPSMEWIRLYNRDPLGLMTQSASDDRDGSVSPPGAADDGDDDAVDAVVKIGNRYETKSTLYVILWICIKRNQLICFILHHK